jgi:hypothetical protein
VMGRSFGRVTARAAPVAVVSLARQVTALFAGWRAAVGHG